MQFHGITSPFALSLILIFIAELGDKTLYTILLLASRHRALPILIGSFAAFAVQGAIALALGSVLALLPHIIVKWVTVLVFAFFGVRLLATREEPARDETAAASRHRVAVASFLMVTAAEWGDASQIGTATLVAHLHSPLAVVLGATAGLWLGTLLAIGAGRLLGSRVPSQWLRKSAGILFCVFAVATLLRA